MRNLSLFERFGVSRLSAWGALTFKGDCDQAVHLLNATERANARAIERATIWRAAMAGAVSSLVAGMVEIQASPLEAADAVRFWAIVGAATASASILEIYFVYWDALRASHRLAVAAGCHFDDETLRREFLVVLTRAALEMPNPTDLHPAINPYRETSRWRMLVAALVYKAKIMATNTLVKAIVKRVLGRAAVRAWLPLAAIPATAAWNAIVCARSLRDVRVRVFGPSLVDDVVDRLLPAGSHPSRAVRELSARAVAACIVRSADLHPNLLLLLRAIQERLQPEVEDLDDTRRFVAELKGLPADEALLVMRMLRTAVVIDGRVSRRERQLVAEAEAVTGLSGQVDLLPEECRRVQSGEALRLT